MLQTVLIAVGAIILSAMVFQYVSLDSFLTQQNPDWGFLGLSWHLWPNYLETTPSSYHHFYFFGPILLAGFSWAVFRILAGPNVWDFQFFLTARSPRDAALAGGMWTVGYTLRWFIGCAFLTLGIYYLGAQAGFDAEKIMPLVLANLPVGIRGLFVAVLLAALMSTLDAMINVTSSVVVNDFLKRYVSKNLSQKQLVRLGQLASVFALCCGFIFSLSFIDVISAWETMIFVIVTMILVPATMRWHWWRFSAKAFVWSMTGTACIIVFQKIFFFYWAPAQTLFVDIIASFILSIILGRLLEPPNKEVLIQFYSKIRPFGFWKPIRQQAIKRGLIPAQDPIPSIDALNGLLTAGLQFSLALVPFYLFLRRWNQTLIWTAIVLLFSVVLYFTWYKNLPSRDMI